MAGRQIRWQSVGRAAAIAAAVIAGIVSLPALLGSDKPPPVPPDVGLTPPPAQPLPATTEAPAAAPPAPASRNAPKRSRHRLAGRKPRRERSHPRPERSYPRRDNSRHGVPSTPAPAVTPTYTPPVYSYVPPPSPGEFQIER